MKILLFLLLIIVVCFNSGINAQTSERLSDNRVKSENTGRIIDQIAEKLERLDQLYLTKLNRLDYKRAGDILNDIYFLLSLIPEETPEPIYDPPVMEVFPMTEQEFKNFVQGIQKESFEKNMLGVVELASRNSYFTVDQVIRIIELFSFSSGKVQVVSLTYPRILDTHNSHLLLSAFTYSADKEKVKEIINSYEP